MADWFVSSVGYAAVADWAAGLKTTGEIYKPTAPSSGNQRCYRVVIGATDTSQPTFSSYLTKGATFTHEGVDWVECTGNENDNDTTFAAPAYHLHTLAATGYAAAGDTIYVANDHNETHTALTGFSCNGTNLLPIKIICIDTSFSDPPVTADISTGAVISSTTTTLYSIQGAVYMYGIHIKLGSSAASNCSMRFQFQSGFYSEFESCTFEWINGAYGGTLIGSGYAVVLLKNCTITTSTTAWAHSPYSVARATFVNCTYNGTVAPTNMIDGTFTGTTIVHENCDIWTNLNMSSKYLIKGTDVATTEIGADISFVRCKIGSTFPTNPVNGTWGVDRASLRIINSDDTTDDEIEREEIHNRAGVLTTETTTVRTGGASNGTTAKSWKIITTANITRMHPFWCPDIYQWVDTTGAKTISIHCANNGSSLTDADIGFEVYYMDDATSVEGLMATTMRSQFNVAVTTWTDVAVGEVWGAGLTYEQKMYQNITINQKGWIKVRVYIIDVSNTIFVDPLIVVT